MRGVYPTPVQVSRALRKLGRDIRDARRRRRVTMALQAERAMISRTTLAKIERGDPGVRIEHVACVLMAMGMLGRLSDLMDVRSDPMGLRADADRLPKRVRRRGGPREPNTE